MYDDVLEPDSLTCSACCLTSETSPVTALYEDDLVLALMTAETAPAPQATAAAATTDVVCLDLSALDVHSGQGAWTVLRRRASHAGPMDATSDDAHPCPSDCTLVSLDPVRVHIHVFPRYEGDPFHLVADWSLTLTPLRLDQIAGRIRKAYAERAEALVDTSAASGVD